MENELAERNKKAILGMEVPMVFFKVSCDAKDFGRKRFYVQATTRAELDEYLENKNYGRVVVSDISEDYFLEMAEAGYPVRGL